MERGTGAAVVWRRVILGCAALIGAITAGRKEAELTMWEAFMMQRS
jgi:hypothetical protein